jgi:spore coat protein U-like protein
VKAQSIRLKILLWLASLVMLVFTAYAQARVTCSISSSGFATAYPMSGGALNITAASFTVTCTANPGGGTATYQVAVDNGINFSGTQNRAVSGGNTLNYYLAADSGCSSAWKGTAYIPATPYTTQNFSGVGTEIKTFSYYGCVPAGLVVPAAGTYTDTVTMNFIPGGNAFTPGTFAVSIAAPASCSFSTQPGNITFNYTSLGAAVLANTFFRTNCSNLLPYNMALEVSSGMIVGLNYTLALNTTANSGGTSLLNSRGTGAAQTFYVNGSVAAGQPGSCNTGICTGSDVHTLTITY